MGEEINSVQHRKERCPLVKGISRRVIVVDSPDPKLFEQAIFIIRNDALTKEGVTPQQVLAADPPLVLLRRRGPGRRGGVGSHHIPVVSKGGTFRRKSPSFAAVW